MSWLEALREHAKTTGKFSVPKRGSPEYEAVKKIQDRMALAAKAGPAPKKSPEVEAAEAAAVADAAAVKLKAVHKAKIAAKKKTPEQIAAETAKGKAVAKAAEEAAAAVAAEAEVVAKAEKVKKAPKPVEPQDKVSIGAPKVPAKGPKKPRRPIGTVHVKEPAVINFV
jgi:hypothetical protein